MSDDFEAALQRLRDFDLRNASLDEQGELRLEQLREIAKQIDELPDGFEKQMMQQTNLQAQSNEVNGAAIRRLTLAVADLQATTIKFGQRLQELEARLGESD